MKRLKFTKNNFRTYLKSFSPKTKVANKKYDCTNCPLARFLKTILPKGYYIHVDDTFIKIDDDYFKTPKWAQVFVNTIDEEAGPSISVSAQKALKILDKC